MDDKNIDEAARDKAVKESVRDSLVACVGIVFAIIVYFIVIPKTIIARVVIGHKMPGGAVVSNPEFMPRLWTIVIAGSSFLVLLENLWSLRKNAEDGKIRLECFGKYFSDARKAFIGNISVYLHVAGLLVLMILYTYLLGGIGFIFSTAICLIIALWIFGYRKILGIIIIDAVYVVVIYFTLTRLLYVIL